jgi:hypothetical protein
MKSAICDKHMVDKIKSLWDKNNLLAVLFLEDKKYEEDALMAHSEFTDFFNKEMYKIGLKNATLSFTTNVALGEEASGEYIPNEYYNKKGFYEDCLKKIPLNRYDEMFQYCIDEMAKNTVLFDNEQR